MNQQIQWDTASVQDGTLSVSLSIPPAGESTTGGGWTAWARIFGQLAPTVIPGVSYSPANPWGRIDLLSEHGAITVSDVNKQSVDMVKAHLDAVVRNTNEEYGRQIQEQEREVARRSEERERIDKDDDELGRMFRGE